MVKIAIKEELLNGKLISEWLFDWDEKTISMEDLITAKVDVTIGKTINQINVTPGIVEKILNPQKRPNPVRTIDRSEAIKDAIQAFKENIYFVLIDDEQITDLHAKLKIHSESKISFIRLTPLIGG